MGNDPTNIWDWVYSDLRQFRKEGGLKAILAENYTQFMDLGYSNPAVAELAINNALDAAKALGDPRWELHLRHWRIQQWLRQHEIKRALPEAIDLLDLALDERVKDIPQRICAYHDVVECYIEIDGAGYYEEIVENAQHVLAQLPQRHPCATCARINIATASAAAGRKQEAEHWLAQCEATLTESKYVELLNNFGHLQETLEHWSEAERHYQDAGQRASAQDKGSPYIEALLGQARAQIGQQKFSEAHKNLALVRRGVKFEGSPALIARQAEVDGAMAQVQKALPVAVVCFTQAGRIYLELGSYRRAALNSLHAAELARALPQIDTAEVLSIAARAVGALPPTSHDVYIRLAALGQEPITPTPSRIDLQESQDEQTIAAREFKALEEILRSHIASGNAVDTASMLHRLGIWQIEHNAKRAAIDYLIGSAALERLLKLPMRERGIALNSLERLSKDLTAGTVEAALKASEVAPPTQLAPLLSNLPAEQWRWTIQAITAEVTGKPVVEPEPEQADNRVQFEQWVGHCASMSALIVRFRKQADPAKCEIWAVSLERSAQEMEDQLGEDRQKPEAMAVPSFARGLAALSRGGSLEEIGKGMQPPFNQIVQQINQIATQPVWFHPESSPLDFLVEQAAQKAVRALRLRDEYRSERLANLAFRYELMTIDLRQHDELKGIASFLIALTTLIQNEGQPLSASETALEEPYAAILAAVVQTSQEVL